MEATIVRVRAFLQKKGYRVDQLTGAPVVIRGDGGDRRWDVVLAPNVPDPEEAIMLSLGRLLTVFGPFKGKYQASLVLPDSEVYRTAVSGISPVVWQQVVPWVRVLYTKDQRVPAPSASEVSQPRLALSEGVRALEHRLRDAANGKGTLPMVRLAQELRRLDPRAFRDQLGEVALVLDSLTRARQKPERRACWKQTETRWERILPRWVNDSIRQQVMAVSATLRPQSKQHKTQASQQMPRQMADERPAKNERAHSTTPAGLGQGRRRVGSSTRS